MVGKLPFPDLERCALLMVFLWLIDMNSLLGGRIIRMKVRVCQQKNGAGTWDNGHDACQGAVGIAASDDNVGQAGRG